MKRYKLKIICRILLLLPVLAGCTDDELLQRSGVVEGIPTTVDINVGTAANTAKTRSALLESEERKIYDLYLWVFNVSGDVEFSREYPRSDLYQAASDLEASTGEADGDAPTSMGLLKNISLTTGEKTLFLLANYKSDGDGLFHVEPDILEGIGKLSDVDKIKAAMTNKTDRGIPETLRSQNHGQPENGRGAHFRSRNVQARQCGGNDISYGTREGDRPERLVGCGRNGYGFLLDIGRVPLREGCR